MTTWHLTQTLDGYSNTEVWESFEEAVLAANCDQREATGEDRPLTWTTGEDGFARAEGPDGLTYEISPAPDLTAFHVEQKAPAPSRGDASP